MGIVGFVGLGDDSQVEVPVRLVAAAVFKTVGPYVKHAAGGFDSHALPPFFSFRTNGSPILTLAPSVPASFMRRGVFAAKRDTSPVNSRLSDLFSDTRFLGATTGIAGLIPKN